MKKIICFDFDGVIHEYTSPWTREDEIHDGPVEGVFDFMCKLILTGEYEIAVYSSRSKSYAGVNAMRIWMTYNFEKYAFKEKKDFYVKQFIDSIDPLDSVVLSFIGNLSFPETKPHAFISIDDRAITFRGTFRDMFEKIENFKPWNRI